jgi:hypothetical protein
VSQFLDPQVDTVDAGGAEEVFSANLSADRTILEVGEAARIYRMSFANSSGNPAEITVVDGASKLKFRETVPARDTKSMDIRFDTSGGLVVEGLTGGQSNKVFVNCFYTPGFLV